MERDDRERPRGGPAAFSALRRAHGSIRDPLLSDRLAGLAAAGVVERSVDAGPPVSVSSGLTDAGRALVPALQLLATWARDSLGSGATADA